MSQEVYMNLGSVIYHSKDGPACAQHSEKIMYSGTALLGGSHTPTCFQCALDL